ncbi:MAG: hypothetical protein K2Y23_26760 [Cyanobacteria bacterium]|nr:hypothetical protein [Cyanobacteriota bacterium]
MGLRTALVIVALSAFVPAAAAQSAGVKTLKANGRVIAISADSMTIRPGMQDMVFVIDKDTKVRGKGVGTKTRALTAANKPVTITELVEKVDSVTVKYQDLSGKLHAREVDIVVKRQQ